MSAPRTDWPAVWAVFAGGLAAGASVGKVPPALPLLGEALGLTLVESGFIATMLNVMGMVAGLLAGVLCDRYGQRRLALVGLALMAAGGLLGALAWSYPALLAARFVEGAGFILATVSGSALIAAAAAAPRERARALGLWSAYMPTGGALALLAAPALIGALGWRGFWALLAGLTLAAAALVARLAPSPPRGTARSLGLARGALASPGNIALSLLFGFYVAQWSSVMIWLPTFAIGDRGMTPAGASLVTALMVLLNVPGNVGGGWLLAHGVRRGPLVVAASAAGALCLAGMLSGALPDALRLALVLAFSAVVGVIPAAIFSGLPVHAPTPQHISTGNGLVMHGSQTGQFFGPVLLAWIATRWGGWQSTLGALLAFAACAAACGIAIGAIERRARP